MSREPDYANYGDTRLLIKHTVFKDPKEFGDLMFKDGTNTVRDHLLGMDVYIVAGQRYIVMRGPGSDKYGSVWSWRLLELRDTSEEGHPLFSSFSSFDEKFMAPVMFMDTYPDHGLYDVTVEIFTKHEITGLFYPLTHTGNIIQRKLLEQINQISPDGKKLKVELLN